MYKLLTLISVFLNFQFILFSQGKIGFDEIPSGDVTLINDSVIFSYINNLEIKSERSLYFQVASIFNEVVDSAAIIVKADTWNFKTSTDSFGIFSIPLSDLSDKNSLEIKIFHKDYKDFDTTVVLKKIIPPSFQKIYIYPKYKILVRGRVVTGNFPVEDVDVEIKHNDEIYHTKTLGCFYDNEDYWNCLYNGMFKQDISTENPNDSLVFNFSKQGFRPLEYNLKVSDYDGDIIKFKMKFADSLPFVPKNDISLKIAIPMWWEPSWFIGLSYYRLIPVFGMKRLSVGAEGVMVVSKETVELNTLPGLNESEVDSTYISGFIGPSLMLWLTKSNIRNFSTYIGNTFGFSVSDGKFSPQPFIGTRFFLDLNKAISFEFRYLTYNQNIVEYSFNSFGNAYREESDKKKEKFIFNVGIQIVF